MRNSLATHPVTVEMGRNVGRGEEGDGAQRRKAEAKPEARSFREVGENKKQTYANRTHLTLTFPAPLLGNNPLVLPQWNDHSGRSFFTYSDSHKQTLSELISMRLAGFSVSSLFFIFEERDGKEYIIKFKSLKSALWLSWI